MLSKFQREVALLAVLLAGYLAVMLKLAERTGITIDEPSHILSAILYWEGNDRLLPRDMPPLIKIVGGWAAAEAGFRIVEESHPVWKTNHEWNISMDMVRRTPGEQLRKAIHRARLPMLIFPIATVILLWWWARELFGPSPALVAAVLFVAEPTALGHSILFKNDHAAMFGFLLFWYAIWRYWSKPGLRAAVYVGVGLLLAILSKLSMLILIPLAPIIIIVRSRRVTDAAAALSIAYLGAVAACQFETRMLLPAPMWDGAAALIGNAAGDNSVYFLGERVGGGSRLYFVVATLVKAPELHLLLLLLGIVLRPPRALWLMAPAALYFAGASISTLQLGFRLILPCLPFAILVMASAVQRLAVRSWVAAAIAAAAVLPAIWIHPFPISYFNALSGGPKNGLRYLGDSNIDWGQDLAEVKRYVQRENLLRIRLSYMGSDSPYAYLRPDEVHMIEPPFTEIGKRITQFRPDPGIYAISANLITGQFFEKPYRDYYKIFRDSKPIAYAGYSIYIYRFP